MSRGFSCPNLTGLHSAGSPAHSMTAPTKSLSKRQKEKIKNIRKGQRPGGGPPEPHYKLLQVSYQEK